MYLLHTLLLHANIGVVGNYSIDNDMQMIQTAMILNMEMLSHSSKSDLRFKDLQKTCQNARCGSLSLLGNATVPTGR